jgi:CHAD domain
MRPGTTRSGRIRGTAGQGSWRGRLEAWRQALEKCGREQTRKQVHVLRVATLRLQTELERWMIEAGEEDPAIPAVLRWMKQARKLRDALKPVREADVCLGMLAELRKFGDEGKTTAVQLARSRRMQERFLKRRLERRRARAVRALQEDLSERQKRLTALSRELETALGQGMARCARPSAAEVRALVAQIAAEHPVLCAENLHEFRKRMKAARYLADLGAATDAAMQKQVAQLGEVQTAAGAWHDWEMLAQIAVRALRNKDREGALSLLMETKVETSLRKALSDCRRIAAELQLSVDGGSAPLPVRKPVIGAGSIAALNSSSAA